MFVALTRARFGGIGDIAFKTSADPENEVCERLPCLAIITSGAAMIEAVVEMLKVEWESPPVPTMSHFDCVRAFMQP
jgi:hypothetical protein